MPWLLDSDSVCQSQKLESLPGESGVIFRQVCNNRSEI